MEIVFGYDLMTYNGPIPNCTNPKFYESIYRLSDFYFDNVELLEKFKIEWGIEYSVFHSNDYGRISCKKSIDEIIRDRDLVQYLTTGRDYRYNSTNLTKTNPKDLNYFNIKLICEKFTM